jgi:hypothetical protein
MRSASPRSNVVPVRRLLVVGACGLAMLAAPAGAAAAGVGESAGTAAHAAAAGPKKKCKKVRVKKRTKTGHVVRRHGKPVYVTRKKCKKLPPAPAPALPAPTPLPAPVPGPTPAPAAPRIDQVVGWSTVSADPDAPPADLTADGGTIASCPNTGGLSVYIRRSGFSEVGMVSYVWKHDGEIVASGTNSSTVDGAFRHGLTGAPFDNGVYEITWTYGGATIGSAKVTRAC